MINNDLQKTILSNCSFFPNGAKYSELKPKDIELENDLYNYHLQQLVKTGLLEKSGEVYVLTQQGKSLVTNIDETTKTIITKYKVSVYLCPVVDKKVLLTRRLKHPQYGYVGLVSGKMQYGENILEAAKRELMEETGTKAEFKIIGNLRQIRKNPEGEVIEDGIFYVCYTDKLEGEIQSVNKEGEYFWSELEGVSKIEKLFKPSVELIVDEVSRRIAGEIDWSSQFIRELMPEPEEY